MTEVEDLKQQVIAELEDISPETMRDAFAWFRFQKAREVSKSDPATQRTADELLREAKLATRKTRKTSTEK